MKETFKKLFEILPNNDKWKFGALFLLMLIGTVLELVGIGMIPVFISAVADPGLILDHEVLGEIASYLGIVTGKQLLLYGGIALVITFLIKGLYIVWLNYTKSKFIFNRFALISSKLFESYLSAPYTFHLNRNTAELIRNVTNETRFISNNVMMPLMNILMQATTTAGIFIFLVWVEPLVTLVSFLVIGAGGGLLLKFLRTKLRGYGQIASEERSRMIQGVNEGLGGFKDVTVMNRESLFFNRFKGYVNNLTKAEIFKTVAQQSTKPVIEFVSVAGMLLIAFTMIWEGRAMSTIIPILTLFGAATIRLMPAVNQIVNQITVLRYYIYALKPVHGDIKSLEDNYNATKKDNKITEKLAFNATIELDDIWYKYPNSDETVLKGIDLSIKNKSAVGFVGPSGAGKSTIVDVILGLLKPEKGKVLVDGTNISDNIRSWQNNIGYIPQFIYLSDDSIRNNIAFGIPEAEISDEKVNSAVEAAQLDELIDDLSQGLDTVVGEQGTKLSGGQRQRIGIARALYDNPEVLIMDEATSSLDNLTERNVISAIEELKGDRTIIMIAHRLTTVKNCDTLYMLKEGKVVEQGTYEDLLNKSDEFRKMSLT
ncbi:ABC transporter ATP-binding protein/permease [Aliifodinibius salicampi]|uniref:ABC transporter ATP-binding protein/permease n=1 Tax=Fodinibius salicampi TaxID=1920655 RepID=A0ABT3PYZ3_9BACT|nr:ABC transporter ATP-binding protein [Fodinibius salicampi]MCW9713058.1 ABC transporter ATP-binding protein/permease [Fodinibius salicampi]